VIATRLGPYEITAKLGEGGMGEVYRATDSRLKRDVAIKVLPAAFTADRERVARFEREAQLLAQLHHPNIASIHGLEESAGALALVMELVEGDDLAAIVARGPVPVDEALAIARQIAEALEAAHERGIVHRDLKPANVKVQPDGTVKVLDFGLAKALDPATASAAPDLARSPALMNSPTLTAAHGTQLGVILGTAAYMAPEQARGKVVDRRADIWAFGCVLYEMLTGRRAFEGDTVSDTMAAVLTREPDWGALPAGVSPRLRALLERCVRKDARERLRDIGDARLEIAELVRGDHGAAAPSAVSVAAPLARPRARSRWTGAIAAVAVLAALAGAFALGTRSAETAPPRYRPLTFARGYIHSARFAPDGNTVIYGAAFEGRPLALFSALADSSESRPIDLPSADIAGISGDGQMALLLGRHHLGSWLRSGTLAQVSLAGGTPRELLTNVFDADISPDGKQFAVVVADGAEQVLQYPIGTVRYRSTGWISQPRIAPDGRRIAFVDHRVPMDDLGAPTLIGVDGRVEALGPPRQYAQGLAWSPDGSAVWSTDTGAGETTTATVWRLSPGKPPRAVLASPTALRIEDVGKDGRLLLLSDDARATLSGQLAGDASERSYSWWDNDIVSAISLDGSIYAGHNPSDFAGDEYAEFFRRGDAPPVQLGKGVMAGMTPDGNFLFTTSLRGGSTVTKRPVGAGQEQVVHLGNVALTINALSQLLSVSADGRRVAFAGAEHGSAPRAWVMDLDGGTPRAVSPDGAGPVLLSPDGTRVAVGDSKRGLYVVPASGGDPVPVPGAKPDDTPLAWSSAHELLTWDRTLPARIYRTDLESGRRELSRELVAADPAGVLYALLTFSPDGRFYLQRSRRVLSTLEVVTLPARRGLLDWRGGARP